jgi:HAD superfamily hydrolase (TIGR01509 family)
MAPSFPVEAYFARTWSDVEAILEAEVRLKTGVMEILDYLDALGVPRAIATSNSRQAVDRYLGRFDLVKRFHAVVANADVVRHKPHPDPYLEAARRLNVHPTLCLALEDSHPGVRAAHAAGMMTIMVPDILDPDRGDARQVRARRREPARGDGPAEGGRLTGAPQVSPPDPSRNT